MSNFYQKSLVILPLFSILSLPPAMITGQDFHRGIASLPAAASTEAAVSEVRHPRFDAWAERVDRNSREPVEAVAVSYVNENIAKLEALVAENREKFKAKAADEAELKTTEDLLKSMVLLSLFIEDDVKVLSEANLLNTEDQESALGKLAASKDSLEAMLKDFEESNPAPEVAVTEPEPEPVASPEGAVEAPVASSADPVVENKPEVPAVPSNHVCEESNKVLTEQVSQLMNNQNQIMLAMMNLTQSMMSLVQQQQYSPWQQGSVVPYSHRYPYHAPSAEGNWVYYPHGFQPASSAQVPFHSPYPSTGGVYPESMNQQRPEVQNRPPVSDASASQPSRAPGFAQDGGFDIPYPGPAMTPNPFGSNPFGFNFIP